MPKVFYTEKDIEDLVHRGVLSLEVNNNVVLTDLAYEKANRLGMKLLRDKPDNPPAAPTRPYIGAKPSQRQPEPVYQAAKQPATQPASAPIPAAPASTDSDLHQRIRTAVIARMGNQVDSKLLDVIIQRVLASTGVK